MALGIDTVAPRNLSQDPDLRGSGQNPLGSIFSSLGAQVRAAPADQQADLLKRERHLIASRAVDLTTLAASPVVGAQTRAWASQSNAELADAQSALLGSFAPALQTASDPGWASVEQRAIDAEARARFSQRLATGTVTPFDQKTWEASKNGWNPQARVAELQTLRGRYVEIANNGACSDAMQADARRNLALVDAALKALAPPQAASGGSNGGGWSPRPRQQSDLAALAMSKGKIGWSR